ncbi:MAG: hypothetical protein ACFCUQ_09930 [Kiloniellales bacterium]
MAAPAAALTILPGARPAQAHAFGPRYDLPLPLDLYLAGAGAAVALSFVIMAFVFRGRPTHSGQLRIDLLRFRPLRALLHPLTICGLQCLSLALFVLILIAGFLGTQDTARNIAPTFVWIIWWVGFAYLAALVGNLWPAVNPWSIIFTGVERLARRLGTRNGSILGLAYPSWLGAWPAAALFGLFAWFELIAASGTVPGILATAILIYSGLTWLAMAAFGRDVWLSRGEAFSLAFSVFGRFAPIGKPERNAPGNRPSHWYLRPYASALVVDRSCSLSMTVFVLVMLSTVTFDGFKETPLWGDLLQALALEPSLHPLIRTLHDLGFDFQVALETVLLALFPLLFLLVYLGFSWLTKQAAGSRLAVTEVAGFFVFSLVPIAIAYHLAHYLSYLLIAGQFIIPLASDPFGIGWNLFGTADYAVDIGIIGARFVWHTAVVAIVVGHVFAVGVAHVTALRVFETAGAALRSQYPFLVLMVSYTMVSLWILSQPIVGSPSLTMLHAPSGTLSLAPFEFRELCFKMTVREELQYDFQSDHPLEFNIHYHDGLTIHYPVRIVETAADSGRFVPEKDQSYCLMWLNRNLARTSLTYRITGP